MPRFAWFGVAIAMMLAAGSASAPAQAPPPPPLTGPVTLITFFETAPTATVKTAALLRQFAAATRKEDGNAGVLALQEISRPGRFAVVEAWRDKPAAEAHGAAKTALRDQLQAMLAVPFDIRTNGRLVVSPAPIGAEPDAGKDAIYVLTHVDVFPAGKDQTVEMLKQLAADSVKDPGNLRFDILQQEGRLNHLPVVEAWRGAAAHAAHVMVEHTRAFRTKLVALQGALYDERLYHAIR
jgi:quinol monooxygenase YgiN